MLTIEQRENLKRRALIYADALSMGGAALQAIGEAAQMQGRAAVDLLMLDDMEKLTAERTPAPVRIQGEELVEQRKRGKR